MDLLHNRHIGFIGGGAMGEALSAGVIRAGLVPASAVTVSDIREERLAYLSESLGVHTTTDNEVLLNNADVVVLAVKPFIIGDLLQEIGHRVKSSHTIISIAAGIPISYIEERLPQKVPVIRVMPNTPCLVREGASAFALGTYAAEEHAEMVQKLFSAVGRVVKVTEKLIDVVTGLSGSGPAYVYLMVEALSDGAVRMGLPRDVANILAAQTLLGAAKMVLETGEHPGRLKDMVTTPGGTTAEGIMVLEEGRLRATLMRAVEAAAEKAREINRRG
ncbi:MAG: pyrroline-5-carboxylate reductase [Peptococcaceae bacterium]|nr:pyrroline-5-carboxylate reductase [Peptococcaceae bacterium]